MIKINLAIALVLLSVSTAKPMYQPALEQTCNFLAEMAPEISRVGGALALVLDESRTGYPMPDPMTERVGNDSQGNDITLTGVMQSEIRNTFHETIRRASDEMTQKRSGSDICTLI